MSDPNVAVEICVVTAFPDIVRSYMASSVLGRGVASGALEVSVIDIRDFASGDYRQIDDYSYGGGGMVLMSGPLEAAIDSAAPPDERFVVYPSPQGVTLHQELVEDLRRIAGTRRLVIVCGHYEGVDERFVERCVDMEISMGDFVLTGGELPALAIVDAVARLVRGVVGRFEAVREDSFFSGMLDHPHYTRPEVWNGDAVPGVLMGGNHGEIVRFRRRQAVRRTISRKPEAIARAGVMPYLEFGVYVVQLHHPVLDRNGNVSTTALTGMDLHDVARVCRTYGVKKYIVATPLDSQRDMIHKIAGHWITGYGAEFNPDRAEAMKTIKTTRSLKQALGWVEEKEHRPPFTIATTARERSDSSSWLTLKERILRVSRPVVFIFGTGWGLSDEVMVSSDAVMAPILGGDDGYNHLSVRSAASIALDRFFGFR
ncbi:MAG: tRNA (guanosine(37)-N1)-methyltransferase TrmD [Synergistaceae bacterium]|nr:tRNA (guanosine(37)-N1)-methyltransferase TrmD [Synergistaceae bacterium]